MSQYAHPRALVTTAWAEEHLRDPAVKFIEISKDPVAYSRGHLPGAIDWTRQGGSRRGEIVSPRAFAEFNWAAGIWPDDTVVFYGDDDNQLAAWALWQFKYHGHADARLLDGGRKKWEHEVRPLTAESPTSIDRSSYPILVPDESIRAGSRDLDGARASGQINLIDARDSGESLNPDGTFKSVAELRHLYANAATDLASQAIVYSRTGAGSSHAWFVLKNLLGASDVKNYTGSWTQWGDPAETPTAGDAVALSAARACVA
jgi:thiosulfate/3-mercaptopyruvate sulfurtransferase